MPDPPSERRSGGPTPAAGETGSLAELPHLLAALAAAPGDAPARQSLATLLADHPAAVLLPPLVATLAGLPVEGLVAVATLTATSPPPGLLDGLVSRPESTARHLALELVARLPQPLSSEQVKALEPLVADRRVPRETRIDAIVQLCRTTFPNRPRRGAALLRAFLGPSRGKAVRRLHTLQRRLGPHPLTDALIERFSRNARMTCPRCHVRLRRPRMARHLWDEHGLVLEGHRARDPWSLIDDWLKPHAGQEVPVAVFERCQALARRADPEHGLETLEARLHPPAPPPPTARAEPEVIPADATRCPQCSTLIPVAAPLPVPNLLAGAGRLALDGYEVAVGVRGLRTRLRVELGTEVLYEGSEPDQWLTQSGALLVLAGPLILMALMLAVAGSAERSVTAVAILLGLALMAGLVARLRWGNQPPPIERAVNYAWSLLVPRLHALEFSVRDSHFLAGVAQVSRDRGDPAARALVLSTMAGRTQHALLGNLALTEHLAALRRLAIGDAVRDGRDPVPLVVAEVARCLEGRLPLAYAQALLDHWTTSWWTPGRLARLRVLLCDRAFEEGLEVGPLLALAAAAPALGAVLLTDRAEQLSQLRLLWSLRPLRPWDRIGPAVSVFEWAQSPACEPALERFGDVLLVHEEPGIQAAALDDGGEVGPVQFLIGSRGVALQGVLFAEQPRDMRVTRAGVLFGGGHELTVDGQRFRFNRDAEESAALLRRWSRYLWQELLTQTGRVAGWQSRVVRRLLRPAGAGHCPHCGRPLLLRAGTTAVEVPSST